MTRRRKRMNFFTGATGIFIKEKHLGKKPNQRIQVKKDGEFAEAHTDQNGQIEALYSKTGTRILSAPAKEMHGVFAGYHNSILVGELTAHTENGLAERTLRGFSVFHMFDALQIMDEPMVDKSYLERYEALQMMHADLQEHVGNDKPWLDDERGRAHDINGRFTKRIPLSWKRTPILPCFTIDRFDEIWDRYVVEGEEEGLVIIDGDAYVGKRGAKRKFKPIDTIDATVIRVTNKVARVAFYNLGSMEHGIALCPTTKQQVLVSNQGRESLVVGDVVEIAYQGFHKNGLPKFPRVVKRRVDLM